MINIHTIVDEYTVSLAALLAGNNKFFEASVSSPSLEEHLQAITLDMPEITGEGYYEVPAETLVGRLDPAFHVARWLGSTHPTVIYHHGNNERPFDYGPLSKNTFKNILLNDQGTVKANLISLRAPYHVSLKEYMTRMRDLVHFAAMLMVSVRLVEHLVDWSQAQGSRLALVSGISLGGWVTNLHRACYSSADVYVPLMAGAALGEVFCTSAYRRLAGRAARENPDAVRALLNFEDDYGRAKAGNVYPLLARYDRIIEYDRQSSVYGQHAIAVIDKGHTTGVLAADDLRQHIREQLERHMRRDQAV